jgi:hypothetical protein
MSAADIFALVIRTLPGLKVYGFFDSTTFAVFGVISRDWILSWWRTIRRASASIFSFLVFFGIFSLLSIFSLNLAERSIESFILSILFTHEVIDKR